MEDVSDDIVKDVKVVLQDEEVGLKNLTPQEQKKAREDCRHDPRKCTTPEERQAARSKKRGSKSSDSSKKHQRMMERASPETKKLMETPMLRRKPRIKLMFQTPEIYSTDVGKYLKGKGSKWACDTWISNKGVGDRPNPSPFTDGHPEIIMHGKAKFLNIQMMDITPKVPESGHIYWRAKYALSSLSSPIQKMIGQVKLSARQRPETIDDAYVPFHKPCVAPDDMTVHHFDIRIWTNDNMYNDERTWWGELESFDDFLGPDAHIGFTVSRTPLRVFFDDKGPGHLGTTDIRKCNWKNNGRSQCAEVGYTHETPAERVFFDEEDMLFDDKKNTNGRLYYEYIYDVDARKRDKMEYLEKYGPPNFFTIPDDYENENGKEMPKSEGTSNPDAELL